MVNEQPRSPRTFLYAQQPYQTTIKNFLSVTDEFLKKPLISRPCNYHTTLQSPHPGVPFFHQSLEHIFRHEGAKLVMLPKIVPGNTSKYASIIEKIVPFGLYWFNPLHRNHVLLRQPPHLPFQASKKIFTSVRLTTMCVMRWIKASQLWCTNSKAYLTRPTPRLRRASTPLVVRRCKAPSRTMA